MSFPQPPVQPQWASDTDDNVTEPTSEKTVGFAPTDLPRREYFNWVSKYNYLWVRWLDAVRLRWSDFGADHFVPASQTLPTFGATLVGTSGAATLYIQGRRVAGVSEAHTYPASRDTYVDLTRDGTWVYASVINGAAAPSLTAQSKRAFMVATDGSNRTAVTDFTDTEVPASQPWGFGRSRLATAAAAAIARIRIPYSSTQTYTLLWESGDSAGAGDVALRAYVRRSGAHRNVVLTHNARWETSDATWRSDSTEVLASKWILGGSSAGAGALELQQRTQARGDGTWDDTDSGTGWDEVGPNLQAGAMLGRNHLSTAVLRSIPRLKVPRTGAIRIPILSDDAATPQTIYLAADGVGDFGQGPCFELVSNAEWDEDNELWVPRNSALESKLQAFGDVGRRCYTAPAGSGSFADGGAVWELPEYVLALPACSGAGDLVTVPGFGSPNGTMCAQKSGTAGAGHLFPVNLPQGAVITGVNWVGKMYGSSGELRAALVRADKSAANGFYAQIGIAPGVVNAYDTFPSADDADFIAHPLSCNSTEELRTIDNTAYSYGVWFGAQNTGITMVISSVNITYSLPNPDAH